MYYKALNHAARTWKQQNWNFYPDENSAVNWASVENVLNNTRMFSDKAENPKLIEIEAANPFFRFDSIAPTISHLEPLIQLADLFAGMGAFCSEEGVNCLEWINIYGNKDQLSFTDLLEVNTLSETSKSKQSKYQVIGEFYQTCKRNRLGVSLRSNKCLTTHNPSYPINFWNYEPQHEYDRAPTK
jgi:hypothetical protein